jgi:hypothetical protein
LDESEVYETFPMLILKRSIAANPDKRKRPKLQFNEVTTSDKDVTRCSDQTDATSGILIVLKKQ